MGTNDKCGGGGGAVVSRRKLNIIKKGETDTE